jgi:ABC-2 type transport system permease protein
MTLHKPTPRRTGTILLRQLYYEQLNFWLNPFAAFFTLGFSVVFLLLVASNAHGTSAAIGGQPLIQYYVPGFIAYGVMSTCFNALSLSIVARRETGLFKRIRLSPLPTWAMISSIGLNALIISLLQTVVVLAIGRIFYGVQLPHNLVAVALAFLVGVVSFSTLGVAVSTLIPNQEAAGPLVNIAFFVLLFLSGLWFPLGQHSTLATISSYFPIRPMLLAIAAPFDVRPEVSGWAWSDLGWLAGWGIVASYVAIRRWSWAPIRFQSATKTRGTRLTRRGRGQPAKA